MEKALANVVFAAHCVWWPLSTSVTAVRTLLSPVLHAIVFLLSPIWIVGSFLLLPFAHLALALYRIVTFPLQVKWLERIETLYIYLGTAGLIGCMTGAVVYLIFHFLSSSLSIDAISRVEPRKGRTAAEFRFARREKQDRTLDAALPTQAKLDRAAGTAPARRGRGLLSQTIVEEEDSDF